jgi:hypothetical protein
MGQLSSTKQNWLALRHVTVKYFKELLQRNPNWHFDDLVAELDLPRTALFFDLAAEAGITVSAGPTPEQICIVASMVMRGGWSESSIASELGIPIDSVRTIFESFSKGYGNSPYGVSGYGGNRKFASGNTSVPRRVTIAGQLKYRGRTYTLGAAYRSRNARVQECGRQLLVTFNDCSPVRVTRRDCSSV